METSRNISKEVIWKSLKQVVESAKYVVPKYFLSENFQLNAAYGLFKKLQTMINLNIISTKS